MSENLFNKNLTLEEISYIAGFLDGDGCITAQIVNRKDYVLQYQIRVSIIFFQKSTRVFILQWLKEKLGVGTIRSKLSDGVSEYTIVGIENVVPVLQLLKSKLRLKNEQATLVLQICEQMAFFKQNNDKRYDKKTFLLLCETVDRLGILNDSKKRKINVLSVKQFFDSLEVPVETKVTIFEKIDDTGPEMQKRSFCNR